MHYTAFLSKIATCCRDWINGGERKTLVLVRFLGSTPISSSKFSLLVSLCQQLSYNLEIPIEDIPQDFVPLKNYFSLLLEKAGKRFFVVILLGEQNCMPQRVPLCLE